ncbi:MAG: TrkH family potassium uptake protein [Desulfobacterales bacterium]|nr:TrkH family potassium uptake protein [Desulfobacterales bacterium]
MREKKYLKQRYSLIFSYVGAIFIFSGLLMLSPLLVLFVYPEETTNTWAFGRPALLLLFTGYAFLRLLRSSPIDAMTIQEGGVIVLLSWSTVILISAWPFMAVLHLSFTQAVFESVSGWTTTGLSVVDVSAAGKMILLWRSTMQLAGGAGFAILMMSAIIGPTGIGLSAAEGRSEQLVPQVRQSARLVLMIYVSYVILGIFSYISVGMSPFDAVNHAFTAVSTGGFSTRTESIGYWDSLGVEAVSLPLMLLGNLSFITAWLLLKGKLRFVKENGELRLILLLIPLAGTALFFLTCREVYPQMDKSIRVAIFETIAALTTTGFSTAVDVNWNSFGVFLLIVLMLIGGGTCSTGGGIKQFRIYMLWKLLIWEIQRFFLPSDAVVERSIWEADRRVFVKESKLLKISIFVFLYLAIFIIGTLILCACGYSIRDSLFEFASAMGTVGLSVGVTSADTSNIVLWTEIVAMFLGRLEFFIVIVSALKLGKDVWRMIRPSFLP